MCTKAYLSFGLAVSRVWGTRPGKKPNKPYGRLLRDSSLLHKKGKRQEQYQPQAWRGGGIWEPNGQLARQLASVQQEMVLNQRQTTCNPNCPLDNCRCAPPNKKYQGQSNLSDPNYRVANSANLAVGLTDINSNAKPTGQ